MAEPSEAKPRRSTWWWVLVTFVCLLAVQAGPVLYIASEQDRLRGFDWAGFTGYSLGYVAVPMAIGCLGLLYRRHAGPAFFVLSVAVFFFANLGSSTV